MKSKPITAQVAIITGGGTGIGRAFAEALSAAGATVVISSRREDVLQKTARDLNLKLNAERVFPHACDILDRNQIQAMVSSVYERLGSIDILINNAGLAVPETVEAITEIGWDTVMDTNLRSVMRLCREVLPHMIAKDFGDIV